MMSHSPFHGMSGGTMLFLAAALAPAAQTQEPHTRSQTSAVQQLDLDSSATPKLSGVTRELRCRGGPGMGLRIHQDSSPRFYPGFVTMVLRYEPVKPTRSFGQEGMGLVDYGVSLALLPGMCTWRWGGGTDVPPEPGVVYFDLPRDGQAWAAPGMRDTTIDAAENFPDATTLPRYLSDPDHYWLFFVDDVTNYSISFGKLGGARPPTPAGSAASDSGSVSRELETSRDRQTSAAGTRTPPPPSGSVEEPVQEASPDRAGSGLSSAGPPTTIPVTDPEKQPVDPSRPIRKVPSSRESPPSQGTKRLSDERSKRQVQLGSGIRNVIAAPGPRGVRLGFHVVGASRVWVQFSTKRPDWDEREGLWAYPPGSGSLRYAKIDWRRGGGYEAVSRYDLEAGARYYYVITVHSREASTPTRQRSGTFTATIGP